MIGLEGEVTIRIPAETLHAIQQHFHALIRHRAGDLVDRHHLQLPDLAPLLEANDHDTWFPIPGMAGGFNYWFEGEGDNIKLIANS